MTSRSLTKPRTAFKPFEYPEVQGFIDAIQHNYWLHTEWTFQSDYNDYYVNLNDNERLVVKRALLAISQIEVSVKKFWGNIGNKFPKPEIEGVGACFSDCELRHAMLYSHLLEVLNINTDFELVINEPVIEGRIEYLKKYLKNASSNSLEEYLLSLTLFSMFIENVSLFSQFLIIKSFRKHKNLFKDVENGIDATRSEEECFIDGTEILTPSGWRLISDMKIGDEVYQYNKDCTIEKTLVLNTTSREFTGNLIEISKTGVKCVVTPNHLMPRFMTNGLEFQTAQDIKYTNNSKTPETGILIKQESESFSLWDALFVALQADGTRRYWENLNGEKLNRGKSGGYNWGVCIKKQRKIDRLDFILDTLSIRYDKRPRKDKIIYSIYIDTTVDYKDFTHFEIQNKSQEWLLSFIEELSKWDGYVTDSGVLGYSSTNKKNVEITQQAGILAGYRIKTSVRIDPRKESYKKCYRVSYNKQESVVRSHAYRKREVEYTGLVSCVSVQSGMIITKYKEDVMIAGNCHARFGFFLINELKKEQPEIFTNEFYKKIERAAKKSYFHEKKIVEWIMSESDLDFLRISELDEFLKDRFNQSLNAIGMKNVFEVDKDVLKNLSWFDEETNLPLSFDFFHKKSTAYNKRSQAVDENDLF